jgi:hypothetical protein
MRTLNNNEKSIVDYIIKNSTEKNNIVDILCFAKTIKGGVKQEKESTFDKKYIKYDIGNKKLWIENKRNLENKLDATSRYVVPVTEVISFLKYLKKTNCIVFINYNADISNDTHPHKDEEKHYQEVYDETLKDFFFQHIKGGIFATEHLKDYKNHHYKTIEQRHHEEQIRKMNRQIIWAIIAASLAAIGTLYPLIKCIFNM